jgi:hypothetical protein
VELITNDEYSRQQIFKLIYLNRIVGRCSKKSEINTHFDIFKFLYTQKNQTLLFASTVQKFPHFPFADVFQFEYKNNFKCSGAQKMMNTIVAFCCFRSLSIVPLENVFYLSQQ